MSDTYRNSRAGGRRSSRSSSADRIMAVQNARIRGTGSRRGGSGRRRGRRQGPDMAKIVLIVIGVLILLICAAVGFQSCARSEDDKTSVESESETETTEPETEMAAEITVNGVQVHGLTKTEAIKKVLEDMGWEMMNFVVFGIFSRNALRMEASVAVSTALVESSRIRIFGFFKSALAK